MKTDSCDDLPVLMKASQIFIKSETADCVSTFSTKMFYMYRNNHKKYHLTLKICVAYGSIINNLSIESFIQHLEFMISTFLLFSRDLLRPNSLIMYQYSEAAIDQLPPNYKCAIKNWKNHNRNRSGEILKWFSLMYVRLFYFCCCSLSARLELLFHKIKSAQIKVH